MTSAVTQHPATPYPTDTLAKGWRFELNMEQVERSDTWLRARNGLNRAYLLMLWAKAWCQHPCGSLPNDDELIALMLDMEPEDFAARKTVLMRGWNLCEDGRLYHATITERVLEMLDAKGKEKARKAAYRARLAGKEQGQQGNGAGDMSHGTDAGQLPDSHGSDPGRDATSTSTGTSTSTSTSNTSSSLRSEDKPAPRKRAAAAKRLVSAEQLVSEGVEEGHALDWLAVRKEKKLPLTQTAWDDTKSQAEKAGVSAGEAVKISAVQGWAGFKASWMDRVGQSNVVIDAARHTPLNKQELLEQRNRAAVADWVPPEMRAQQQHERAM